MSDKSDSVNNLDENVCTFVDSGTTYNITVTVSPYSDIQEIL